MASLPNLHPGKMSRAEERSKMLIYDVLHKEKVYQIVAGHLRTLGVKYRIKKNAVKDKPDRNASALKKVFKTSLSYLPLDVVNLSSGAIIHVPLFVSQATAFLLKSASQEGLFRKAGSQIKQKEIIARLDNGSGLGEKNSPLDVANCLKTFLRNLPEPLIPYNYHDLFVRCNMLKKDKIEALLLACIILPPHHLNTLAYLMEFFKTIASYEKQNKMGVDNLARVIGPNIMPLQETTMIAVQTRLEAHLTIVKLLIENAEKIGVLPHDISEAISMDAVGSIENELNGSDPSSFKSKKKKHRSGSLTRMLSGLKKMVGKNNSPNGSDAQENYLLPIESALNLYTPSLKSGKKRKVDSGNPSNFKRKQHYLEVMPPSSSFGYTYLFSSPVSNNPNPLKEKSPNHKSGVQKYLSQKIIPEMGSSDKISRPKKLRLSLDRFVPRSKHKISEQDMEIRKNSFSPCPDRRWSSTSNSSDTKKRRRTRSISSPFSSSPRAKIRNSGSVKYAEEVFLNAEHNLSDNVEEQPMSQEMSDFENKVTSFKRNGSTRKPTHSYSLRKSSSPNSSDLSTMVNNKAEEFVKIPKSEYEEIKNRVSAIESRISQEFKSINDESGDALTISTINQVQNEYEKTLVEAGIENTASTDQLAKRLSRELKIRRSAEHKVIRSPSARKIGTIRRRSQERPTNKKVYRTASWNVYDRPIVQNSILKTGQRLNNSCYPKQCNLKRGRPLVKRDSYKSLDQTPKNKSDGPTSFCSDETNARLNYLQEQLNALISHTAEHTRDSFSDDDITPLDDIFEPASKPSMYNDNSALNQTSLRRASSFHNDFIDNSQYFNNRIKELKKTNSHQNLITGNHEYPGSATKTAEPRKEKTVSWKDADNYFKQEAKTMTPVPQSGRASVAKLRTQNAGMVLAKAKLFDDPTKEPTDVSRRQSMKVQVTARAAMKEDTRTPRGKKVSSSNEVIVRRKHNSNISRRPPSTASPLIKMEVTISNGNRRQATRMGNHEEPSYSLQKESHLMPNFTDSPIASQKLQGDVNVYKPAESPLCKTPHIKKSLNVKTPKSAKSLSARRSAVSSRRTPLKAVLPITPKRQSPRILKLSHTSRH